jgi:hypothetical protein
MHIFLRYQTLQLWQGLWWMFRDSLKLLWWVRVFWVVVSRSSKASRHLVRIYRFHLHSRRVHYETSRASGKLHCLLLDSLFRLLFGTEYEMPKYQLTFTWLHGVISQENFS